MLHKRAHYIIKRNLRKESPLEWLAIAKARGISSSPRPGKMVRRGSIRREVSRRRIRKVIQDIVRFACKFVRTARRTFVKIRADNPWTPVFERLYRAYT